MSLLFYEISVSFVFFPGGNASPDVALGLVLLQHRLCLKVKGPVEGGQPLAEILMYRGFAHAEFDGRRANRGPILYDLSLIHI